MTTLALHEVHAALGGRFTEERGCEAVADYGDALAEHAALRHAVGVVDLSFRGRLKGRGVALTGDVVAR